MPFFTQPEEIEVKMSDTGTMEDAQTSAAKSGDGESLIALAGNVLCIPTALAPAVRQAVRPVG